MIKNYCIKIISSVFIMLTIFMVSTSVFAIDSPESIKFYPVITDTDNFVTIDIPDIPIHDGYNYVYLFQTSKSGVQGNIVDYEYNNSGYCIVCCIVKNEIPYYIEAPMFSSYGYDSFEAFTINNSYRYLYDSSTNSWVSFPSSTNGISWYPSGWAEYTGNSFNWNRMLYSNVDIYAVDNSEFCLFSTESLKKKIIYEVNYSEDNKTAILSAEIKNCAEGDKLYYSTLGYSLSGKLMNPIELNQSQATAITLNRNTMIHLQALDSER